LTEEWNQQVTISNANGQWINLGTLASSPRFRTVTDQYVYGQMCSMLLENQLSGGLWAGTVQFNLANLQLNLQKRCNEVIQATSCNISQLSPINAIPGTRTGYALPDTALEARRNRFLSLMAVTTGTAPPASSTVTVASGTGIAAGQVVSGTGIQSGTFVTSVSGVSVSISLPISAPLSGAIKFYQPLFITREDVVAFQSFETGYLQTVAWPSSWSVTSDPPLTFEVDNAPNTEGYFDVLALNASPTFNPPTASLLGVPDDWSMVPMYGALANVLSQESQSTDDNRASYCLQRYNDMTAMMQNSNWILQTIINGQVSSITALADMDAFAVNWQESQSYLPAVIEAGMDMIAPVTGNGQSLSVVMVDNAPLLDATNTYVQVSRDDWAAVLDYAHHVATFKLGGKQFTETMPLLQSFYRMAAERNKRWLTYGPFVKYLRGQGLKQEESEPRYAAGTV
jgi:hypothetical protein